MATCGTLSPIVGAPHRLTAYAASTITILGLLGVVLLPAIGAILGLTDATGGAAGSPAHPLRLVSRAIPWFVVGFVLFAGLRSIGVLDVGVGTTTLAEVLSAAASLLILVALAGVGLGTDLRAMAGVGPRPFLLGVAVWARVVVLGLVLAVVTTTGLR